MFLCLVNLRSCVQNLKRTRIQQVKWSFVSKAIASNDVIHEACDQKKELGTQTAVMSITTRYLLTTYANDSNSSQCPFRSALLGDLGPSLPQWSWRRTSRGPQIYTVRYDQTHLPSPPRPRRRAPLHFPHVRSRCQGLTALNGGKDGGRRHQGEGSDGGPE